MGKYCSLEQVRLRLVGKVRFTDNEDEAEDKMYIGLANKLIAEAEAQVEQDMSQRYSAPFQTHECKPFENLPEITKQIIRTLSELMSVIRILETDFGSGTAIDGEKYIKRIESRYNKIISEKVMAKVDGASDQRQWLMPPLPGLKLSVWNKRSDDGYAGMVLVSSGMDTDYAGDQINDPAANFYNGVGDWDD